MFFVFSLKSDKDSHEKSYFLNPFIYKTRVFLMFFTEKVGQTVVFMLFSFFFPKGSLCQTLMFLLCFALDGEDLELNFAHLGFFLRDPQQ